MPPRARPHSRTSNVTPIQAAGLCVFAFVIFFSLQVHKKLPDTLRRSTEAITNPFDEVTDESSQPDEPLTAGWDEITAGEFLFVKTHTPPPGPPAPDTPAADTAPVPPPPVIQLPNKFPVSRNDLLVAIPTSDQHLSLVNASRLWRKGIRTLVCVNSTAVAQQQDGHRQEDNEAWRFYSDDDQGPTGAFRGLHAGDTRAAVAPYLAHHVFGDSYKWILYGDDDTMWFVEGLLPFLEEFDPDLPYFVTDNLWWSSVPDVIGMQPHMEAPRCLPCHYTAQGEEIARPFNAPVGCPCTPKLLCDTYKPGVFNEQCDIPVHPHRTYSMHGGAGGLLSVGLMRLVDLEFMEKCIEEQEHASGGDAFITICLWRAGFAHSDPGWSFSRPDMRMFDPLGDGPNLLTLLRTAASEQQTDAKSKAMLDHMVSAHIRSRTSSIMEASDLQVKVAAAYQAYLKTRS